jgi:hypothetical protein
MDIELLKAWLAFWQALITAGGTITAAVIVGIFGGLITRRYSRERDRQDKEGQWRAHAIELAKLDLERKLKRFAADSSIPLRPSVLDFLANYRDLLELDKVSPWACPDFSDS